MMNEPIVDLKITPEKIAVVCMQDRESKNTFSKPLIEGLQSVFERIKKDETLKVVLIHGYENMFCAGGTKDELIGIFEGKLKFTDLAFYRLLIDCDLPVIAAMQGHALGGGLVFGMYADVVLLARESLYGTNFMKYGFTPGMGATLIIPEKFGRNLASEMLFSAKSYHGGELKERGVPFTVVPKAEVISQAMALAKELADKPRGSLMLLKNKLRQPILKQLQETITEEVRMHDISFAQPEVRQRIEVMFGN